MNTLQGEDSNKNVENLETGNSSCKVKKDASDSLLDRFMPNRSAMDYDYAHYMLTEGRKIKENQTVFSPARDAYRMQLAERISAKSLWAEMVSFWTTTGQWRHDSLVHIWDMPKASSNSPTQWIHRLEDYTYGIWDMSKAQELAKEKADITIKSLQCLPQSLQIIHLSEKK
ncbi:hypothetical protein PVK06_004021 [Gossypium arboreum]|uniref:Uncharacterized protein n=1 Tax=Gossypium arboreum TaxID=29729 RepID=A0ABR0QRT5_GOSAR|nr:hypothetical protein PVK06_004021 [Gossypium arboreum]